MVAALDIKAAKGGSVALAAGYAPKSDTGRPTLSYFSENCAVTVTVMVFSREVVSLLPSQLVPEE